MNSQILALDSLNLSPSMLETVQLAFDKVQEKTVAKAKSRRWQIYLLTACVAIITSVAVYDVYWSFRTADTLAEFEENPIGSWLIRLDHGNISLFMTCKMVGTMFVILAVPALYRFRAWWGLAIGVSLAIGQLLVFTYLNCGHLL